MKVSTLQEGFLKEFGLTLRVYDGREFAAPSQTLAQVRKKKGSGKDLSVAKNMKVGNLEDKFEEEFGLKVQVAGSDDSYLCDDNLTLNAAQQEDEKKLARKDRKAARQAWPKGRADADAQFRNRRAAHRRIALHRTGHRAGDSAFRIRLFGVCPRHADPDRQRRGGGRGSATRRHDQHVQRRARQADLDRIFQRHGDAEGSIQQVDPFGSGSEAQQVDAAIAKAL